MSGLVPEKVFRDFFSSLNENKIRYLFINGIGGENPENPWDGKNIRLILHAGDKELFAKIMSEMGFSYTIHPFGPEKGWNFAYGLERHMFWQKENALSSLNVEACFRLCVKSLMPKTWVPLDEKINSRIWANSARNEIFDCPCLDEKTQFVYLFAHCVFDRRNFSKNHIDEIEKRKNLLDDSQVRDLLSCVFYKFTPTLLRLTKNQNYEEIVHDFLSFKDY